MSQPIICFGQQPCGFFPKRFLAVKINTAKKLRDEIGGRIVFFYHDSDADYRETITVMKDLSTAAEVRLNFLQPNKIQKKFSPLYAKYIAQGWKRETLKQLPRFADRALMDIFSSVEENQTVADFCLEMYKKMGLLDGIEVFKSSDKNFREQAPDLAADYFADVQYQGEVVRARIETPLTPTTPSAPQLSSGRFAEHSPPVKEEYPAQRGEVVLNGILHEGGDKFIRFPITQPIQKSQKSPARDQRFLWMQSVINCTHYIYGEGEKEYLDVSPYPDIKFVDREKIENPSYAWIN